MSQFPFHAVGDPFPNNQRTVNAMMDAAKRVDAQPVNPAATSGRVNLDPSVILVKNTGASAVARYGVLGVTVPVTDHATNAVEFLSRVYMSGAIPRVGTHDNQFAIALEDIPAGGTGRCAIHGLVQCQVTINDQNHLYADITDNDTTKLSSGPVGSAKLYFIPPGVTGDHWALVYLGTGIKLHDIFPVTLAYNSGADGNQGSANAYTYDVSTIGSGVTLETALDPTASPHSLNREIGAATAATRGTGYYQVSGSALEFVLHSMDEDYTAGACS